VVTYVVLKVRDVDAHTVIDVVTIVREAQIIVLVGVLLAGFAAVRDADAPGSG